MWHSCLINGVNGSGKNYSSDPESNQTSCNSATKDFKRFFEPKGEEKLFEEKQKLLSVCLSVSVIHDKVIVAQTPVSDGQKHSIFGINSFPQLAIQRNAAVLSKHRKRAV